MEQRNESIADKYYVQRVKSSPASYKKWTIENAVKEGYTSSGWVYRAVSLTMKNAASVPWMVYDKNGEPVPDHHLSRLLKKPNASFSAQDSIEMITAWLELGGEAFWVKIKAGAETRELWLYSPDRMNPIPATEKGKLVDGWLFDDKPDADLIAENVIHLKYLDPANPIRGISPLMAAARTVDVDNEQQDWNKEAMQNRGVMDGFFSFKSDINETQFATYRQKIKEMFTGKKNARAPGVIGSQATYQAIGMKPAEMDFLESRKFSREEIFMILGVPLPLAGSSDAMTYNNYQSSLRIFWESKILPLLDDIKDALNNGFSDELGDGFWIGYDKSGIAALSEDVASAVESAERLFNMGVPFKELNKRFKLGIEEFAGWDQSFNGKTDAAMATRNDPGTSSGAVFPYMVEIRAEDALIQRDAAAENVLAPALTAAFKIQQTAVFDALQRGRDPREALDDTAIHVQNAIDGVTRDLVIDFALNTLVTKRGMNPAMETRDVVEDQTMVIVDAMIQEEQIALVESGYITTGTAQMIMEQVRQGVIDGASVNQIQQAIIDVAAFSPERALRVARTASGTMQSIGQLAAGVAVGATKKTWQNSGFNVRERHIARNGETVPIEGEFSGGLRYPLDIRADADDRINCRCSMTFE